MRTLKGHYGIGEEDEPDTSSEGVAVATPQGNRMRCPYDYYHGGVLPASLVHSRGVVLIDFVPDVDFSSAPILSAVLTTSTRQHCHDPHDYRPSDDTDDRTPHRLVDHATHRHHLLPDERHPRQLAGPIHWGES